MIDSDRPYRRTEIDTIFTKTKASMQQAALKRGGDGIALYIDVYTGKTLRGGDSYDYEHLRSSEAVHTQYIPKMLLLHLDRSISLKAKGKWRSGCLTQQI